MATETPLDLSAFRRGRPDVAAAAVATAPAPPAAAAGVGFSGTLPFVPGVVIRPTPGEQAVLDRLNISAQAVPGNLAEAISAAQAAALASTSDAVVSRLSPVPPGTPALHVQLRAIEDLPPEHQQRLVEQVRQMQEAGRRLDALPTIEGPAAESIRRAMLAVAKADLDDAAAVAKPPSSYGSLPSAAPAAPVVPAPAAPAASTTPDKARIEELEAALSAAVARLPPPGEETPSGDAGLGRCQHCGWDLAAPDETNPTEAERHAYLAMVLGGEKVRFRRDVPMFGGAVVVRFRTLTQVEAEMTYTQALADERAGRLQSFAATMQAVIDYRLPLQLESLMTPSGFIRTPDASAVAPDDGEPTPLPILVRYVDATVLPSETLQRAVVAELASFNRIVEKLESNARNDPFWAGAVSPT